MTEHKIRMPPPKKRSHKRKEPAAQPVAPAPLPVLKGPAPTENNWAARTRWERLKAWLKRDW